MSLPRNAIRNERRASGRQRKTQNLLEVSVRTRLAKQQRTRAILVWTCKLLIIGGLLGGGYYGAQTLLNRFLWQNPEYNVTAIDVSNSSTGVSRESVLRAAGIVEGSNIFKLSLEEAQKGLDQLAQVEHASIKRIFPNKIAIEVIERRPLAWVVEESDVDASASENSFLIDGNGVLFRPERKLAHYLRLPTISGIPKENIESSQLAELQEMRAALDLIHENNETGQLEIRAIDLKKGYCLVVTDSNRTKITFDTENIPAQLSRLAAIFERFASKRQQIQTVNLVPVRNIPVTMKTAGTEDVLEDLAEESQPPAVLKPVTPGADNKQTGGVKAEKVGEKSANDASSSPVVSLPGGAVEKKTAVYETRPTPVNAKDKLKVELKPAAGREMSPRIEPFIPKAEPVIRRAEPVRRAPVTKAVPAAVALLPHF